MKNNLFAIFLAMFAFGSCAVSQSSDFMKRSQEQQKTSKSVRHKSIKELKKETQESYINHMHGSLPFDVKGYFLHEKYSKKISAARRFVSLVVELKSKDRNGWSALREMVFQDHAPILVSSQLQNEEQVFFRLLFEDSQSWNSYFSLITGAATDNLSLIGTIDRRLERGFSVVLHQLDKSIVEDLNLVLSQNYANASKETLRLNPKTKSFEREHEGMGPKRIFDTYFRHTFKPDEWLLAKYNSNKRSLGKFSIGKAEAQHMMLEAYSELVLETRKRHGLAANHALSETEQGEGVRMGDYSLRTFKKILSETSAALGAASLNKSLTKTKDVALLFGGSMARGTATLQSSDIDGYLKTGNRNYLADTSIQASRKLETYLSKHLIKKILPVLSPKVKGNLGPDALQVGDDKSHRSEFVRNLDETNLGRINPLAFEVGANQTCIVVYSIPNSPRVYKDMLTPILRVFELKLALGEESKSLSGSASRCHTQPSSARTFGEQK